jgi:tetratricopeptide (TPR) repeat protein
MHSGCALTLVAIALLVAPSTARAEEGGSESEPYVQRGIELRRAGKNQDALEAFQHAYAIRPTPRVGAQIALARQALGDWVDAERGIEDALRASDDSWIARYRDLLEQALATVRGHLGTLYVEANVSHGDFRLNGLPSEPMPSPDQPIRLAAGTSRFELRAPGYVSVQRTVEIAPRAQVHVVIALEPMAAPGPSIAALAPEAPWVTGSPAASPEPAREALDGTRRRDPRHTTWAYVAFAAAGALTGAGAVAWRVHENNAAIYNDDSRCQASLGTRGQECGTYSQTANVALGLEIAAFAAAAGSAVGGAWLLWAPRARSPRVSATCAPWSTLGVLCTTPF